MNQLEKNQYMKEWRKKNRTRLTIEQRLINSITGINTPIPNEIKAVHSHHMFYKSLYPKLSLNINNGIPISEIPHKEVHGLI